VVAQEESGVRIVVVGVGGAGCNAVDRMISVEIPGVSYLALNTDAQALARNDAPHKICLGGPRTRGLGAGGDPQKGAEAANHSRDEIASALEGADLVFIAAGMGGGTGSGASPIVGDIARANGALVIAVVTLPFSFEGHRRRQVAEAAVSTLQEHVDTLIVVPNDRLLSFTSEKLTLDIAFRIADDVLRQGIQGISEVITRPGLINVDFADVRRVMKGGGRSLMAVSQAKGPDRALEAAASAVSHPLLDSQSIAGARGILVNIVGGPDMTLHEASKAMEHITAQAAEDAEVIFGAAIDNSMADRIQITLIATGLAEEATRRPEPARASITAQAKMERSLIVPREFEQRLAALRHPASEMPQPNTPSPAVEAPVLPRGALDIPAFLRRMRSAL
jgi:cell division protein FtsZ